MEGQHQFPTNPWGLQLYRWLRVLQLCCSWVDKCHARIYEKRCGKIYVWLALISHLSRPWRQQNAANGTVIFDSEPWWTIKWPVLFSRWDHGQSLQLRLVRHTQRICGRKEVLEELEGITYIPDMGLRYFNDFRWLVELPTTGEEGIDMNWLGSCPKSSRRESHDCRRDGGPRWGSKRPLNESSWSSCTTSLGCFVLASIAEPFTQQHTKSNKIPRQQAVTGRDQSRGHTEGSCGLTQWELWCNAEKHG